MTRTCRHVGYRPAEQPAARTRRRRPHPPPPSPHPPSRDRDRPFPSTPPRGAATTATAPALRRHGRTSSS
eukprot:scaffold110704_cov39-Phaeocystis_antarctica.AAC.1